MHTLALTLHRQMQNVKMHIKRATPFSTIVKPETVMQSKMSVEVKRIIHIYTTLLWIYVTCATITSMI